MKLASHNTFTYLPVRQLWLLPFAFMARCQRKNINTQWLQGARMFDLRVRFDRDEYPVICHGLVEYEGGWSVIHSILFTMNGEETSFQHPMNGQIYFRVVLETSKPDARQEDLFREFCEKLESRYRRIKFFGGNNRTDWDCKHPIYKFEEETPKIEHRYSSTQALFPNGPKWLRKVDDLCPVLYARLHNRESREAWTGEDWLMLDFVDIQ